MPGIYGFKKDISTNESQTLIEKMSVALDWEDRFLRQFESGQGWGLGRNSLGILNQNHQPLWDKNKNVGLVFEGELYDTTPLKNLLNQHNFECETDEEILLGLYLLEGDSFSIKLNGAFSAAFFDNRNNTIIVMNDRLGLHPVYYANFGSNFLFASGVRGILVDQTTPRRVNRVAIQEFLTFDHLLHQNTLLEDVNLLPQGSILKYQNGKLTLKRYFHFQFLDIYPFCEPPSYQERFLLEIKKAVQRQIGGSQAKGIMLSGGLDSRFLLAVLADILGPSNLHTFTWSIPGSDDARYAKEAAGVVGTPHHFFELKPDWLLKQGEKAVKLTDGMGNLVNLHAIANLADETQIAQIIYKGFMGDAMFGFGLRPRFWADYDRETEIHEHLQAYRDYRVLTFDIPEHAGLFTESFLRDVGDGLVEDYKQGVRSAGVRQMATQRLFFDLTQRVPRMTINGVLVARDRAIIRLPFTDNDLVEFSMTVPPYLAFERKLMIDSFIRAYPRLARIPTPRDHLPLTHCAREVMIRNGQFIKWHLRKAGFGWLAGPEHRPYKDYQTWFRTALREWVEQTLLSSISLERGYFKPESIRQVVKDHMGGKNNAVKIGALMAIELWHKYYID
ncbi:asparagine synthase [Bellilinea caldifistulae]|nr:asparagine synthase-related protein [Bellilinea caldifistulae]GAP10772.1 asparagine synthase [Bellilinea caldifistulae]